MIYYTFRWGEIAEFAGCHPLPILRRSEQRTAVPFQNVPYAQFGGDSTVSLCSG